MDIVQVDIKQLNPAEYNPRKLNEEQFNNIISTLGRTSFAVRPSVRPTKQRSLG